LVALPRSVSIPDRVSRSQPRTVTASALHLRWHAGQRRVRLYCAEELRPSACCIVDALHARGYEVSLFTGPEARSHLRIPASAEVLRVVWAPEVPDRATRDRLRAGLDPEALGDVMVLGATTPRGVIEAVDAFGAPPRRRRLRAHHPRRTYLAHPTLIERRVDTHGYGGGLLAAGAIAIALLGGLALGARHTPEAVASVAKRDQLGGERLRPRLREEPVLAAGIAPLDDLDPSLVDDDEPIILDDELDDEPTSPTPERPVRARTEVDQPALVEAHAALAPAPLERMNADRPSLLPAALAASGGVASGTPNAAPAYAIDPF
jgi:hypothetical protein